MNKQFMSLRVAHSVIARSAEGATKQSTVTGSQIASASLGMPPRNDDRLFNFGLISFLFLFTFSLSTAEAAQIKKVYRGVANFDTGDPLVASAIGGTVDPAKSIVLISYHSTPSSANSQGERNYFFQAQLAGNDTVQIERGASNQAAAVTWQVIEFADGARVQSGISSLDKGQLTKAITLPPLTPAMDITKAVPIISFRTATGGNTTTGYARTHEWFLKPTLSSGPTLTLDRLESSEASRDKPVAVAWQVIEFQTDANVYSGEVCLKVAASNGGPQSVTNDGADPDGGTANCGTNASAFSPALTNTGQNAFLFYYPMYGSGMAGEDNRIFVRGTITNGTTVTFTRGYATTTALTHVRIGYYVVDLTDGSGSSGNLGQGAKGSLASGSDPAIVTVSSSTDAVCPTTIRVTTSANHGFAANDFVTVGAHTTNTAANGTWVASAVPTATTFDIQEVTAACVEGSGGGAGSSGSTSLYRATDMSTPYGTVDSSRLITMVSASGTSASTGTTNTWADDLLYTNYLYQKGTTWYLETARCTTCRAIAADYEYITYEFPMVTLKTPNGGGSALVVDALTTVTWAAASAATGHNWKLQIYDGSVPGWVDMTGATFGTCDDSTPTTYALDCNNTATGVNLSAGSVNWKVPDKIRSDLKIRLWDETDTTSDSNCKRRCDQSNANFQIKGSVSAVTVKQSGSPVTVVGVDSSATIEWTQTGTVGNVTIDMDTDNDGQYGVDDTPDDTTLVSNLTNSGGSGTKSWTWNPVNNVVAEDHEIRVVATADATVNGTTGIAIRPSVKIIAPTTTNTGASAWLRGKTQNLVFCTTGTVGDIKLFFSSDTGAQYSPVDNAGVINGGGSTTITPTYTEDLVNCPGTSGVAQKGTWAWPMAATAPVGTTMKIRIEKSNNANVLDYGPDDTSQEPDPAGAVFEIKASVGFTAPPTTEGLRVEADKTITWSVSGGAGVTKVKMKYTTAWSTCQNQPSADACWQTITTPDASNLDATPSTFNWNVANIIGTDVGIRIEDNTPPTPTPDLIYDKRGAFTVKGRISTVSAPAAKDVLRVGTNKTIQWDAKGSITAVDVCLLKESSTSCDYTIATGVALPTESAAWNSIASTEMCTVCEVKVFLPGDATAENADGTGGVSKKSGIFSVKGNITNATRDAASYNVGTNAVINWTANPTTLADSVRVRYDNNSGLGTDSIANTSDDYSQVLTTVAASNQTYTWPIPSGQGLTNASSKVRVEYVGYGLGEELSGAINSGQGIYADTTTFSIKGTLTLTNAAKNGGVSWNIGTEYTITWARNGSSMGNASIYYSRDGGSTWNLIKTLPSGNETYTWCVGYNDGCSGTGGEAGGSDDNAHTPGLVITADQDADIKIRIESADDPTGIFDCTGATCAAATYLTINKAFTTLQVPSPIMAVSDPADTTTWKNITWVTKGVAGMNVLLRYDTGALTYPNNVNPGGTALSDAGGYLWQIPDSIGYNNRRFQVKSENFGTDVHGESGAFTIKGAVKVNNPTGSSTAIIGTDTAIQYLKLGTIGDLEILYYHNTYVTTVSTGTSQASTFTWQLPATDSGSNNVIDVGGTKNSKFKITGLTHQGDANLEASIETALFQVRGSIRSGSTDRNVVEPAGGEVYAIGGANQYLLWRTLGTIGNVRLRLDTNQGKGADDIANNADDYATQIRRPDSKCGSPPCYAESIAYNIQEKPGDTTNSSLEWIIPDSATIGGKVLIESLDNPYVRTDPNAAMSTYGVSATNFRIRVDITGVTPSGTPNRKVNDNLSINWTQTGTGNVNIVLWYDNDGAPYDNSLSIVTNTNTKPYPWQVTSATVAETAIFTVSSAIDSSVSGSSASTFKIKPLLNLLAPNSNAHQWIVGTSYNVTWDLPLGSASSLKINFSTNGGKGANGTAGDSDDWPDTDCVANLATCQSGKGGLITASVASSAQSKSWTIPDILTNEGVVRISKVGDTETYDDSNAYFYIKGEFTNVHVKNNAGDAAPGTPIDLPIDNDKWITWNYSGSMSTVNIYYTTDGNATSPTWTLIPDPDDTGPRTSGANVPIGSAGSGSYQWKIPNAPSPYVKVKVANVSNPNWQDVSQVNPNGQTGAGTYNSIIGSITEVNVIASGNPSTTDMEVTGSKTIRWKPNGAINTFRVDYRKNGLTWTEITPTDGCGPPNNPSCYTTNGDYREWTWTGIPDQISNDIDFKAYDFNDQTKVSCESFSAGCNVSPTAAYILKGKLSVVSPISTDIWTVGTTHSPSIQWNKKGTIGDLQILYSTSGTFTSSDYTNGYVFTIETAYASGADGTVSYAWSSGVIGVNRKISDTGKLQITNVSPPAGTELTALSDPFKIRPSFTSLNPPASGNIWYVADTNRTITWACNSGTKGDGTLPKVTLKWRVDGGSYTGISGAGTLDCANGSNNYTWPSVDDAKSNNADVQVSFNDYPTYNPLPSAAFKIHPRITVTNPISSTKLKVGSTYNNLVTWSYTGTLTTTVDIRYDTNGGAGGYPSGQVIAAGQAIGAGAAGVTWGPIPDLGINTNVKIKVFDPAFTDVYGETASAFKVHPGVTVTAPEGAVNRTANSTMTISWTYTSTAANVGNVNVYYDPNSGLGVDGIDGNADDFATSIGTQLSGNCSGGTCSYVWDGVNPQPAIPDTVLNTARVMVKSASDSDIIDEGTDFKLGAQVSNLQPTNGAVILAGATNQNVTWTKDKGLSNATKMKIEYTNNASAGTPTWVTITPGPGTDNTGSFLWNPIPGTLNDLKADNRLRITQQTPDNSAVTFSGTGNPFTTKAQFTVTAPNGGGSESWLVGTNQTLTFTKKGAVQSVDFYYSHNGSTYYGPLNGAPLDISALADDTAYDWSWSIATNTTLTAGYVGKIKVKAVTPAEQATALAEGISAGGFQLKGSLSSVAPSGASDLEVSGSKSISWSATGNIPKFRVFYRYNNNSWVEISPGGGQTSSPMTWNNIPNTISNDVDFRVEDYDNANVNAESAVNNIIKGKLSVTSPISTDIWTLGATPSTSIQWNKTGTIGDLLMLYSTSGTFGASDFSNGYVFTIESAYASGADGTNNYSWASGVIGANRKISETGKVKLSTTSAPAGAELSVTSDPFKIRPSFTGMSSPTTGEVWYVGETTRVITWSCNSGTKGDGSLPTVIVEYNLDGGSYNPVAGAGTLSCSNGSNSHTWPSIPDVRSSNATIRVSYNDYTSVNIVGPASGFKLLPQITVTNVTTDGIYLVGSTYNNLVKWSRTGTQSTSFKVLYSTNGGIDYPDPANLIADNQTMTEAAAGVTFAIPNAAALTNNARIKVVDKANSDVFGQSGLFNLKGDMTLTAPDGTTNWSASTTQQVGWNFTGSISTVNVYYDPDSTDGAQWTSLGSKSQSGSSGSSTFDWGLPAPVGNNVQVKIEAPNADADLVITKISPDFKIKAVFDITEPENGAVLYAANSYVIRWTPVAGTGVSRVKLEYSNNASAGTPAWNEIDASATITNSGSYTWNPVPGALADLSNDIRVRISQKVPLNANTIDTGTGTVVSIKPTLTVTVPNTGSDSWNVNTTQTLKFKKKGAVQSLDLWYSHTGNAIDYVKINVAAIDVSGLADDTEQNYLWFLDPATTNLTSGFTGRVKAKVVTPSAQNTVESAPSAVIEVKGNITLDKPVGTPAQDSNLPMTVGGTYRIQWTKFGAVNNVEVHYSTNGGVVGSGSYPDPTNEIFDGASTPAFYDWTVPNKVGTNLRIRVRHKENTGVWMESTNAFRIKGALQLSVPEAGGLDYVVGTNQTITWTSTGSFTPLDLHYDLDGNFATTTDTYPVAPVSSVTNCTAPDAYPNQCTGNAVFNIEDRPSNAVKVRIRGTGADNDIQWISTNAFRIKGQFNSLSMPAANDTWYVGDTTKQIRWSTTGTISNVKIEYKTSVGGAWVDPAIVANDGGHTAGDNTYNWTAGIPNVRTNDAYIRICSSTTGFTDICITSGQFKMIPTITISDPALNQKIAVGGPTAIKWGYTGSTITFVKLYYATDGATFTGVIDDSGTVAVGAGAGAGFTWNIPDSVTLTTNAKVKVMDADGAFTNVFGTSQPFKLQGSLTLTAPLGSGTTWNASSTNNSVSWTWKGAIATVKVYYDLNSGKGPDDIAGNADDWTAISPVSTKAQTGTSGSSSLAWNMPANVVNTARVKITDLADETDVKHDIGPDFKIGAVFDLTEPENGAVLTVGSSYVIRWTPVAGSGVTNVKLEYSNNSSDASPVWNEIDASTTKPNSGNYTWNPVPGALADLNNDNKMRISQKAPSNTAVVDTGTGSAFQIKPTLTVTVPGTGSESWGVNTTQTIKFKKKGAIQSIDLYYSYDGAALNYVKINGAAIDVSALADDTEQNWDWYIDPALTLTSSFAGKIKAKVVNPSTQSSVEGIQSNAIEVKGTITVRQPGGVDDPTPSPMEVNSSYLIKWDKFGAVNNVDLHFSTSGCTTGNNFDSNPIITGLASVPSNYNWTVADKIGTNVCVRVKHTGAVASDVGDTTFRIKGKLQLSVPEASGLDYVVGTSQTITWTSTGTFTPLDLHYDLDGNFATTTDTYTVAPVSSVSNCTPGGSPPYQCTGNAAFTIEDRPSVNTKVRIRGTGGESDVQWISTNAFRIKGQFNSLSMPAANDTWYVGETTRQIRWSTTGTISNVKIEYKTSAGGAWVDPPIVANDGGHTAGDNTYNWTAGIPNVRTNDAYIRICSSTTGFTDICITSGQFKMIPTITISDPALNQKIAVGGPTAIKWGYTGSTITFVKLYYATDGATFTGVIDDSGTVAVGAGAGAGFTWNIPDSVTLTTNAKVKVMDADGAFTNVFGTSQPFKLQGSLTLTAPLGSGTTWNASSTNNSVSWTWKGAITTVKVYYDLNSGKGPDDIAGNADDWTAISPVSTKAQTGTSGSNSLAWNMPANVVNTARVKITDLADETDVKHDIGPDFKIGAVFDLTEPENGAVLTVGSSYVIRWTPVAGSGVSNVKLEYSNNSSDGTPTWNEIDASTTKPNSGNYTWNPVPGVLADLQNDNRLRISQKTPLNAAVVDTGTGTPFSIKPVLEVTVPGTGSESWGVNTTQTIKFKKWGAVQSADFYYSYDGAALNYVKVNAAAVDVSGVADNTETSWAWYIDPALSLTTGFSGKIKMKVVNPSTQSSVEDIQSNGIQVKGVVTVRAPGGVDDPTPTPMDVGSSYLIKWDKFGAVTNVDIHLSTTGCSTGNNFDSNPITTNLAATPSNYSWTVSDKIGSNSCIRVRDTNNASATNDVSDATFRIKGKLQLSVPEASGLSYVVGTNQTITWTTTGTFTPVELHYDVDGNFATTTDTYPVLPLSSVTNCTAAGTPPYQCTGNATFNIEDRITLTAKVRIRGTGSDSDANWISTNGFRITGALDVTSPESGQVWYVGDTNRVIAWNATGTITNVKIQYKTSLAGGYSDIVLNDSGHVAGANTYTWSAGVADEKTETAYIRVCSSVSGHTDICNDSGSTFSIRPRLTVTQPLSTARLVVNSNNAGVVKWSMTGTKTTLIDILYDTNDGKGPDGTLGTADDYGTAPTGGTIATSVDATTGAAGAAWNSIPDKISNLVRVRIFDSVQSLVFDDSDNTFKIVGSIALTAPPVTQPANKVMIKKGGNYTITWTKNGSFANVNIWFAKNGVDFNDQIVALTPAGNNQYAWTGIQDWTTANGVIRVADNLDPETKSLSYPIALQSTLNMTAPDGGEVWAVNTPQTISWSTDGTSTNVYLQYATDGGGAGGSWTTIPDGNPDAGNDFTNTGTFAWTVPNAISDTVKVRVVDNADPPVDSYNPGNWNESGATFKIKLNLAVVYPNGNSDLNLTEKLRMGTANVPIQWSVNGTSSTVKLQLSLNGGIYNDITTPSLATNINAATGQPGCTPSPCWNWTVPDSIGLAKVRVVNEGDTTVLDPSDFDFKIRGTVTWTYPTVVDTVFEVADTKTLTWSNTGSIPTISFEYSTNNGATFQYMKDLANQDATDISNVDPKQFSWLIPNAVSKQVILRIRDSRYDPPDNDGFDSVRVKIAGIIGISDPNSGTRWGAQTTQQIKWSTVGSIANLKIEYSLNGGTDWISPAITDSVPATGQSGCSPAPCQNWVLPTTLSSNALVRISDVITDSGTTPKLSSSFKIVGSFGFTAPTGSSIWAVTDGETGAPANPQQNIVWTTIGTVPTVNVWYSPTGSAPWTKINSSPINDGGSGGTLAWTVPDIIGANIPKIRIEDATETTTESFSSPFTVRGDLKLTSPAASAKWSVSDSASPSTYRTISWWRYGTVAQVNLDYSKTGSGGPWIPIPDAATGTVYNHANSGSFSWKVPDDMTLNGFIRIKNVSGPAIENIMTGPAFKITARFDITQPDSGAHVMTAGQNYDIRWNKWGSLATNVRIELATGVDPAQPCSAVSAASFNKTVSANTLNDGIHSVNPVDVNWVSPAACLRIYDVNDIDSEDRSFTPFIIRATFAFTQPTSAATILDVGQVYRVTWARSGNISQVLLQYSPGGNNFLTDTRNIEGSSGGLVSNTDLGGDPTLGSFDWTVPDIEDTKDENVRLRVRDPNDTPAEAYSDASIGNVKIVPKMVLTFPDGNSDPNLTNKLKVGTPYTITWTSTSSATRTPTVEVAYSTNGGSTFTPIINTANANDGPSGNLYLGSFIWGQVGGIPDLISPNVKIRVMDVTESALCTAGNGYKGCDMSNYDVKIISDPTLGVPNGNPGPGYYEVGDPITITWSHKGSVSNMELHYATDGATFSSPVVVSTSTNANNVSTGNGSFAWQAPNAIGYNTRVRVRSLTDDGFDISDADFRIRGKIAVTAPTSGARLPIAQSATIGWTATGTIPNVDIKYDINDGKGADNIAGNADDYPYTIATGAPGCTAPGTAPFTCTATYNWTSVPDTSTALGKIKIFDSRTSPNNTDVIGYSQNFNIIGNFTLLTPNGNEDWRVNTNQTISFNWGGTMANVNFYYTKNNAADPATIPAQDWIQIGSTVNYGAGDGSGGAVRTQAWTIPNDISNTVRVKVANNADSSVYDVSNAFFPIRGSFTMDSLNGNADPAQTLRMVTYQVHPITWTSTGSMPNVKLEYSDDNFTTNIWTINTSFANCIPVSPAVTCSKTYNWLVPDNPVRDAGTGFYTNFRLIKVRVSDANDTTNVKAVTTNPVKIDHYKITWGVRDEESLALLAQLNLTVNFQQAVIDPITSLPVITANSVLSGVPTSNIGMPQDIWVPAANFTFTWKKANFGDISPVLTVGNTLPTGATEYLNRHTTDPLANPPLDTMKELIIHISRASFGYVYDSVLDKFTATAFFEFDGRILLAVNKAFFKIFDDTGTLIFALGSSTAVNPRMVNTDPLASPGEWQTPDAYGYFKFTLNAPTNFDPNKLYTLEGTIYRTTGAKAVTPQIASFKLDVTLQDVAAKIDTPLSTIRNDVNTALASQTTTIQGILDTKIGTSAQLGGKSLAEKMDLQTAAIDTAIDDFVLQTDTQVEKLQDAADFSKAIAEQFSWKALADPERAKPDETVVITAVGVSGKTVSVTIVNADNKEVYSLQQMTESSTKPGTYTFSFKADKSNFKAGKAYRYIVEDTSTSGNTLGVVRGQAVVSSTDIDSIAGMVSSVPGIPDKLDKMGKSIDDLTKAMSTGGDVSGVKKAAEAIQKTVDELPKMLEKVMTGDSSPMMQVKKTVDGMSEKLEKLAGNEGYDLSKVVGKALSNNPTIKELRQKADDIQLATDTMQTVVESKLGKKDDAILKVNYTAGSVKLRVVAVNPSESREQQVPVKIYLPKEATSKDILDMGDLELDYDTEKSQFFVFKNKVTLKPKEVRVFEVVIEDIWFVPQETLTGLRSQTEHIIERLKGTPYLEKAQPVANTVYKRLTEIAVSQADESVNKELHIGIYRTNMKVADQIKEDIARLEKLLVHVGAPPAPDMLAESKLNLKEPSRATTWFIIFAILIFIGVLAAVFYFTWQSQARFYTNLSNKMDDEVFPEMGHPKSAPPTAPPSDESS